MLELNKKNHFKLAGLRASALVYAPTHKSFLVKYSIKLANLRLQIKQSIRQFVLSIKRRKNPLLTNKNKLRVLVHILGGIGDVCMTRVFLKTLRETLPNAIILLCYDNKNIVEAIFQDKAYIDGFQDKNYYYKDFDLIIKGCHFWEFIYYNKENIKQFAPKFIPNFDEGLEIQKCFTPFFRYTPNFDGMLAEIAISLGGSRIQNLGWFSGLKIGQNDRADILLDSKLTKSVLDKFSLTNQKYITLNYGINTNTAISGNLTRSWSIDYYKEFCKLFKETFPQIKIVQLGGINSYKFDFVDICLVGKTQIKELPHILANAIFHFDGESGMVHLANLTKTTCVVLYGASKAKYLSYKQNINIESKNCAGCMNITKDWMSNCILGKSQQEQCLASIKPIEVFERVKEFLINKI